MRGGFPVLPGPLLVTADGLWYSGNLRFEAAKKMGLASSENRENIEKLEVAKA